MRLRPLLSALGLAFGLAGCATTPPEALRGTGDLGVVIERAAGRVQIVEHSTNSSLATVPGLGDLSHAHVTFSRDGRFAYVFGRDGGGEGGYKGGEGGAQAHVSRAPGNPA